MTTTETARRRWWTYLGGYGSDVVADQFFFVCLAWAAAHGDGAVSFGLIMAVGTIARTIATGVGGALADRIGLLRAAMGTLAARSVLLVAFGVVLWTGSSTPWLIATSAAFAIADGVHLPAMEGITGFVADTDEAIGELQGLLSSLTRVAMMVGTPIAGAIIGWRNAGDAAMVAAGLTALSLLAVVSLRRRTNAAAADEPEPSTSLVAMLGEGWRAIRGDRALTMSLLLFAISNGFSMGPIVLGVAITAANHQWSGFAYGFAYGGFAVGGLIGALGMARLRRRFTDVLRVSFTLLFPAYLALAIIAVSNSPIAVGLACFACGLLFAASGSLRVGWVKSRTPKPLMGRVMGALQLSFALLQPIGYLVYGSLVESYSVAVGGLVMVAILLTATLAVMLSMLRGQRQVRIA